MIENRRSIVRKAVVLLSSAAVVAGGIFVGAAPASATVTPAVTVTKLSVNKGSTTGGTAVLITGKGFTTWTPVAADVTFNAVPVTVAPIVISDTQMAVAAPAGTAGATNVLVADTVGSSFTAITAATSNAWTYIAPLAFTAYTATVLLNPLGGTVLPFTVTSGLGANQAALTAAKITATVGGVTAKVTDIDDTHGTIAVPAGTSSAAATKVCVLSNGVSDAGSCDATHAKYATVISKMTKTSSVLTGNASVTAITITGKGFTGVNLTTGVSFGANAAACTSVLATADTKLVCTIPAATLTTAGSVVQVIITPATAPYGTTAASAFTYTDV
jgi:hypothetical protein